MNRRRWILGLLALLVTLIVVAAIIVHLPGVQGIAWRRAAAAIEEVSGYRIEVETLAVRVLPATLDASGVTVAGGGRTFATIDHVSARWRWRRLLDEPRRLEVLVIEGVAVDLDALPIDEPETDRLGASPLKSFEIGELRVTAGGGGASITGIEAGIDGVEVTARLEDGLAVGEIRARELTLTQAGRRLVFGPIEVVGSGGDDGVNIDGISVDGTAASVRADGRLNFEPAITGGFEVEISADIAALAGWWDPNLVSGLDPSGRLELEGTIELAAGRGPQVELRHRGGSLRVAGYDLESLSLAYDGQRPTLELGHPGWGEASATLLSAGTAELRAHLKNAPADRALSFMAPQVAGFLGSPVTLSGDIDAVASFPVVLDQLSAKVDLVVNWPDGRIAVRGDGTGTQWEVASLEAEAAGATLRATGRADLEHGVNADAVLTAAQPQRVADALENWLPALSGLEIGGGPLAVRLHIDGPFDAPALRATATWSEPVLAGRRLDDLSLEASGTVDVLDWDLGLMVMPGSSVTASGTARPLAGEVGGVWSLEVSDIAELSSAQGFVTPLLVRGRFSGEGSFGVAAGDVQLAGTVEAEALGVGEWSIDRLRATFETRGDAVEIRDLQTRALRGRLRGLAGRAVDRS